MCNSFNYFFKVPFYKNIPHPMPKTTWKRSRACTCSSASTRCPQWCEGPTSRWKQLQLMANSLPSVGSERSWSNPYFVLLRTCSTASLLMWAEVNMCVFMLLSQLLLPIGIYSDYFFPSLVHPSRVFGTLFQSADWCFGRFRLHWVSDRGGGLPLTAFH